MTCAYAVRWALTKFSGAESVDVTVNEMLATAKLKPCTTMRSQGFWKQCVRTDLRRKKNSCVGARSGDPCCAAAIEGHRHQSGVRLNATHCNIKLRGGSVL